ncbi:MAG: hypothetical protein JJU31_12300 [Wenzhouxiangella sp.]|nr:hypothetical protein [Wenzhouxiangella sp.]
MTKDPNTTEKREAPSPPLIDFPLPPKGQKAFPGCFVYPFFLFHMLGFGGSGFFLAYGEESTDLFFLYIHGGFAILIYTVFYLAIFGFDEVKWMFINAGLGLFGIYAQIDLLLAMFGKRAGDFPVAVHVIPFLYYVLYTFLLYQMVIDLSRARNNPTRRRKVELVYVLISLLLYGAVWTLSR